MKITIQLDCPERCYRRSFEAKLPLGGGKDLFQDLVSAVHKHEQRLAIREVFEELQAMSPEEFDRMLKEASEGKNEPQENS